ncbi:MAG: T9SS type A sorting domain-containing protein [Bacteroidales bacterium]|nr:T9SS type A sorting domain-containing protein [Bacteroidales bacterium]
MTKIVIVNGQQFIRDNVSYEIYATKNAFPSPFYNQIIDEDIHLSMEADSTNLKSGRIGYGRYLNLIPKSRREYEENKAELLATLPKIDDTRPQTLFVEPDKKGVLRQNIPNPATGSTTVVYDVVEEGAVELRLYNQLGQLLQLLPQGTQSVGSYRIEISLVGLPSAMYHYILFVEGEKADAKKLIVN